MTRARVALGRIGEDLAVLELERRGYAILARRYRRRGGELDIVARDDSTIVFVEVKTRDGSTFGAPVEAVTATKRRRIVALACDYMMRHQLAGHSCRFDIVSIRMESGTPFIELFRNAFDLSS